MRPFLPTNAEAITLKVIENKPGLKLCLIHTTRRNEGEKTSRQQLNVQEVKEINPIELAKIHYREKCGTIMDEPLSALLTQVVDAVKLSEQNIPDDEI